MSAAGGREVRKEAPTGPPSAHWPEEPLDPKDERLLRRRPRIGQDRMIWVTTDERRATLQLSADDLYKVIRDFYEEEARRMASIFGRQPTVPSDAEIEAAVRRALDEYDWSRWNRILRPAVEPVLTQAVLNGARSAWDALRQANISLTWDTVNEWAVHYARQRAAELVGMHVLPDGRVVPAQDEKMRIDQVTRRALHFKLVEWLKEGRSWRDIAKQLESFDGWNDTYMSDWRARRIARTEAAFAYNRGTLAAFREVGIEKVRVFDGTQDAPCAEANGQIWTIEEAERRVLEHPHCSRHFAAVLDDIRLPTHDPRMDEPPEAFATVAEAETWARARWPHVDWDLAEMDVRVARAVVAQMHRLMRDFPDVARKITYVGTYAGKGAWRKWYEMDEYTYAHATPDYTIAVNPFWARDADAWLRSLRADTKADQGRDLPWHVPGTDSIEAVITHEFAHQIHRWILEEGSNLAFAPVVRASGLGLVRSTFETLLKNLWSAKPVSAYAATHPAEAWAEAVATVYHGAPAIKRKPQVQSAKAFLELLHGPLWQNGEWRWLTDVESREVREHWIRRLQELAKRLHWTWG